MGAKPPVTSYKQLQTFEFPKPPETLRGSTDSVWADLLIQYCVQVGIKESSREIMMQIIPVLSLLSPENDCAYQALGCTEICEFSRADFEIWHQVLAGAYGERVGDVDCAEMRFPTKFYADLFNVEDYYLPPPPEDPKKGISEVADVNRVLRMIRWTKEIVTSSERKYSFQTLPLQYKLLLLEFVENQVIGSDKYYGYFSSIDEKKADLNRDKKELRQALVQFNADKDQRKQDYQKRYAAKKAEIQAQMEKIESYKTGRHQRFLQSAEVKLRVL